MSYLFFFFNDTATTEIYTLSLHDALPILLLVGEPLHGDDRAEDLLLHQLVVLPQPGHDGRLDVEAAVADPAAAGGDLGVDRKSTRLNSSHANISYAVFCLKKKKTIAIIRP